MVSKPFPMPVMILERHCRAPMSSMLWVLLTVRGNTFKPAEGNGNAEITDFASPESATRTRHVAFIEPEAGGDVDITEAEFMLSIGRGIAEEDNVEEFLELADTMGFTLGCSRPIADSGWLPKSRQVSPWSSEYRPLRLAATRRALP